MIQIFEPIQPRVQASPSRLPAVLTILPLCSCECHSGTKHAARVRAARVRAPAGRDRLERDQEIEARREPPDLRALRHGIGRDQAEALAEAARRMGEAREAARQLECTNNLKQIGIAFQNHIDARGFFPPANVSDPTITCCAGAGWAWGTLILPFIDQSGLYDQLSPNLEFPAATGRNAPSTVGASATLAPLVQTNISGFRCPSDPAGWLATTEDAGCDSGASGKSLLGRTPSTRYARSNYVVSMHDLAVQNDMRSSKLNGISFSNSRVKFKDLTDGSNYTLAAGERIDKVLGGLAAGNPAPKHPASAVWAVSNLAGYANPDGTNFCFWRGMIQQGASANYPINDFSTVDTSKAFSSFHADGAMFVFCDGSVRFLNQSINSTTFQYLANRKDGKSVSKD